MSRLNALLRRIAEWLTEPVPASAGPSEAMADWADRPAYHPRCDGTPR